MLDNGRILEADYLEIYLNEIDLEVIADQYDFEGHLCVEVETALKGYLPRWFTDYVFSLFKDMLSNNMLDIINLIVEIFYLIFAIIMFVKIIKKRFSKEIEK